MPIWPPPGSATDRGRGRGGYEVMPPVGHQLNRKVIKNSSKIMLSIAMKLITESDVVLIAT